MTLRRKRTSVVGAAPVLGREGVHGEVDDPEIQRAAGGVEQRLLAGPVPLGAGQALLGRPPAVAVHDAGHVARHAIRIEAVQLHDMKLPPALRGQAAGGSTGARRPVPPGAGQHATQPMLAPAEPASHAEAQQQATRSGRDGGPPPRRLGP